MGHIDKTPYCISNLNPSSQPKIWNRRWESRAAMSNRRSLHNLSRHASALFSKNPSLHSLTTPIPLPITPQSLEPITTKLALLSTNPGPAWHQQWSQPRHFSTNTGNGGDEDTEDEEEEEEDWESSDDEGVSGPSGGLKREYSPEEKEAEAAAIGYKVVGPLEKSDRVFKPYEPAFAVVQVQSALFWGFYFLIFNEISWSGGVNFLIFYFSCVDWFAPV